MLPELLEDDAREQVRPRPAARRRVERRQRLRDRLAIAAGELLADGLDDLPGGRHPLDGLGDGFAELRQPGRSAACAVRRGRHDDALARQVVGEGLAGRALARGIAAHARRRRLRRKLVLRRLRLKLLQLELIDEARRALGAASVEFAPESLDLEFQCHNDRFGTRCAGAHPCEIGFGRNCSGLRFGQRGAQGGDVVGRGVHAVSIAKNPLRSLAFCDLGRRPIHFAAAIPQPPVARCAGDCASRWRPADNRVARTRSQPRHRSARAR